MQKAETAAVTAQEVEACEAVWDEQDKLVDLEGWKSENRVDGSRYLFTEEQICSCEDLQKAIKLYAPMCQNFSSTVSLDTAAHIKQKYQASAICVRDVESPFAWISKVTGTFEEGLTNGTRCYCLYLCLVRQTCEGEEDCKLVAIFSKTQPQKYHHTVRLPSTWAGKYD